MQESVQAKLPPFEEHPYIFLSTLNESSFRIVGICCMFQVLRNYSESVSYYLRFISMLYSQTGSSKTTYKSSVFQLNSCSLSDHTRPALKASGTAQYALGMYIDCLMQAWVHKAFDCVHRTRQDIKWKTWQRQQAYCCQELKTQALLQNVANALLTG